MARTRGGSLREILIIILLVASVALVGFDRRGSLADKIRGPAAHVFAPTQSLLKDLTLSLVVGPPKTDPDDQSLEQQIVQLRKDLRKAEMDKVGLAADVSKLRRQLADIKQLVAEFNEDYPLKLVPANVLSREYIMPQGNLRVSAGRSKGVGRGHWVVNRYLSRGTASGVRDGQPVLTGNGLVGIIDEVSGHFSQVRLVTSEKCILPVRVMHWDPSQEQWVPMDKVGDLKGTGDGRTMVLENIPIGQDHHMVAPGDMVVTAGAETGLPEYAIIGRVAEVSYLPSELSYRIIVEPRVDLDRLDQVYILSPRNSGR
jgi:cell shape-determining protein MreC